MTGAAAVGERGDCITDGWVFGCTGLGARTEVTGGTAAGEGGVNDIFCRMSSSIACSAAMSCAIW